MEIKVKTYIEPTNNEIELQNLNNKKNYSAYYATAANAIYDLYSRMFYDAICIADYRCVRHEYILPLNGLPDIDDIESDNLVRITFSTSGFYNGRGDFGGKYMYNDLGIEGLRLSGLYQEILGFEKMNNLKSYDLDLIDSYCQHIKKEQEDIRSREPNFNPPVTHHRRIIR